MESNLSKTAVRRLQAEQKKSRQEGLECGFFAAPQEQQFNLWDVFIKGSEDSLYEGTVMHAQIRFPFDYPIQPPKMKFITEMFHPNIYPDGKVCISILHVADDDPTSYEKADEKWTPVQSVRTIVLSVTSLLNEPNCNSPANVDASKLFNENIEMYNDKVRKLAQKKGIKYATLTKMFEKCNETEKKYIEECLYCKK
ncbi:ubiquitin conjugating enzyme Ubc7/UbcP3 [Binucleata daphniae]